MGYELTHDTIAKQIFNKASTEAQTRRKIEKFIREAYQAYQERGAKLTQDDVDYVTPYLPQVSITDAEAEFIAYGRRALRRARRRVQMIIVGVMAVLAVFLAIALIQWNSANAAKAKLTVALDDAIEAKDAAQAAQERTVNEVIEASWKAGAYLGETDKSGVEGIRDLYKKLQLLMDLKKAQSLSPVPIFIKGPHQDDFDVYSNEFGYYNPELLAWAKGNVIPAEKDGLLRQATQPFYGHFIRDMARIYYLTYQQLEQQPALRDRVQEQYLGFLKGDIVSTGWVGSDAQGGGIFFENRFGQAVWPYVSEIETRAQLDVNNAYYYWVVSLGFWIRRRIDTTAPAFMEILENLLRTYDAEWLSNPPQLPSYYE